MNLAHKTTGGQKRGGFRRIRLGMILDSHKSGGFRHIRLGLLVAEEPAKAAETLMQAWTDTGTSDKAAALLNISQATFWRYVNRLEGMGYKAKPRDADGKTPQRGGTGRTSL